MVMAGDRQMVRCTGFRYARCAVLRCLSPTVSLRPIQAAMALAVSNVARPSGAPHGVLRSASKTTEAEPETVEPETTQRAGTLTDLRPDRPWLVIVWNDPVNLMSYVTFVFQKLFGYSRSKATRLMLDVHHKGRAVVSSGPRERAELDVYRLHEHGLWATLEQSG